MMSNKTIKQLEEKSTAQEIELLAWSNRTDLIAVSNTKGEVSLHRLNWTRAWCLPPYTDTSKVNSIAWSPNGKVLAVSYNIGIILLVNVENKNILHKIIIEGNISCSTWAQGRIDEFRSNESSILSEPEENEYMKYLDLSSTFLSDPPLLKDLGSNALEETFKINVLQEQKDLNLLVLGTKEGFIHISIFGHFPIIDVNLNEHLGYTCSVEQVHMSEMLNNIFVTIRDENDNIQILILNCDIFRTHTRELFALAYKHEHLISLINYLSSTINVIKETWENILLEMDAKLSKYASKVPEGGVTADFLDLLLCGISSPEMEEFLVNNLTKKGLEKFGQSVEISYTNIQKLLLKYVTKTGQNITYHLAELRGLARLEHKYKILGLKENNINEAIQSNGSFLIKCGEMQEIINHSLSNYKAFFRWLYIAIMNLLDEPVPAELPKMTQQDLANITEFLQNFDNIGIKNIFTESCSNKSIFIMERLGQYVSDGSLNIPAKMNGNDWSAFVTASECMQNHPSILKHNLNMSLIQQFDHLNNAVVSIFIEPKQLIKKQCQLIHVIKCCNYSGNPMRSSFENLSSHIVSYTFLPHKPPADSVYFLKIDLSDGLNLTGACCNFPQHHTSSRENYQIIDVKYYSSKILSLLLQDRFLRVSILYQISCLDILESLSAINIDSEITQQNIPIIQCEPLLHRNIDNILALTFSVSGCRKLCIVLSESRRKIRLFEMEAEEDEDETDLANCTVSEIDVVMQENNTFK